MAASVAPEISLQFTDTIVGAGGAGPNDVLTITLPAGSNYLIKEFTTTGVGAGCTVTVTTAAGATVLVNADAIGAATKTYRFVTSDITVTNNIIVSCPSAPGTSITGGRFVLIPGAPLVLTSALS